MPAWLQALLFSLGILVAFVLALGALLWLGTRSTK
jgi:hypothetical protein